MRTATIPLLCAGLLSACATTPSGRSQVMLVDERQAGALGIEAFAQLRDRGQIARDPRQRAYVDCVASALIAELPAAWRQLDWEVELFVDPSANAFALPGGKVGVNTGMIDLAADQHQLAAVIGHELAHVVYRHGAERMSQQLVAQAGLSVAGLLADARSPDNARLLLGALGAGAQVGVLLPFSRFHETEADLEGQRLMARAGFDPAASLALWQAMDATGGARPPTWLSTHPNPGGRLQALQEELAGSRQLLAQAREAGRQPQCRR
ncbi:MAG: M48 family metallopeptidase [Xanthomonadales bacterium]|nr:M48 family metallopeptidase [Xanthomonadales bacterium]